MIDLTEGNGKKISLRAFALRYSLFNLSFIFFFFFLLLTLSLICFFVCFMLITCFLRLGLCFLYVLSMLGCYDLCFESCSIFYVF